MVKARKSRVKCALFAAAILGSALAQRMPPAPPRAVDPNGYYYGSTPTNTTYNNQKDMLLQETSSSIQDYLPLNNPYYR
jgi:uncharacterized protein YfaS (alpha-2-macroglobulin family)